MRNDVINRPFCDTDVENVVAVLKENFGNAYFYDGCYSPETIIEENRSGKHLLFVAELETGEFVGVVGAKRVREFTGSYELSMHVLRKKFQGQGLAKPLLRECMRRCEVEGRAGTYGHCVTYHVITQNEMAQLGMHTTGMWPGRHSSARSFLNFYGFQPHSPKLHSLVIVKRGPERDAGVLYPPERHRVFVEAAYAANDAEFREGAAAARAEGESLLSVRDDAGAQNTDLYFWHIGADAMARVNAALAEIRRPMQCFTALVNMKDAHCPALCAALEERGFYFTGVHPLHRDADYALYHYEMPGGYDWKELKLTPENRVLLDYILEHRGDRKAENE